MKYSSHILTESVIENPEKYTLSGSFEEVICFLNGYYSSVSWRHPVVDETWDTFMEWFWKKYKLTSPPLGNGLEKFCDQFGENSLEVFKQAFNAWEQSESANQRSQG